MSPATLDRRIRKPGLALSLAIVTVVVAAAFVAYALSGADLCIWCPLTGK